MHWTRYSTLTALMLVGAIGVIDSVVADQWDSVVMFVMVILLSLPLATSLDRSRRLVLLRNDLAGWVDRRSATTGEPAGAVLDRAVARHRERLDTLPDADGGDDARAR